MTDHRLKCAEVRERIEYRRGKIAKHERAIVEIKANCAHDEMVEERDYQDPKPYRRCLGCGRGVA